MQTFDVTFPRTEKLDAALAIARRLHDAGHIAYLVGGCVRDALLGRAVEDYDIATDAPPARVAELFKKTFAVGEAFGVMIVVHDNVACEVATFRSESGYADLRRPSNVAFSTPEEDVRRRDFTINGLFFDPAETKGLDYVGGIADMEQRVLRTIGEPDGRFGEDALRLLRAIRFAATFDLSIESETRRSLIARADSLRAISSERVGEEWMKGLLRAAPRVFLDLAIATGIARVTMPEVEALREITVADTSVIEATASRFEIVKRSSIFTKSADEETLEALVWAALFFEVGRTEASHRTEQGLWLGEKMMFPAAEKWREASARLKFSNQRRRDVARRLEVAAEWQNFDQLTLWRRRELLGDPLSALDEALLEAFAEVYQMSSAPLDAARKLRAELAELGEEAVPPPLLDGRALMQRLNLKPSPVLGELLTELRRLQLDRRITNEGEALAAAKNWLLSNDATEIEKG